MLALLTASVMTLTMEQAPADLLSQVDAKRLRATVAKLSSWRDRNTNNPTVIEAAEWVASEYRKIPGMQVELMPYKIVKGPRIREDKEVVQVVATLPGLTNRRVLMGGHLDTISLPLPGYDSASPGANDDASGVAGTMECARILASTGKKFKNTLVFIAFTGEEQGLLGARALAERAKAEKWEIEGVLNNDMIGNTTSVSGRKDSKAVRVFSTDEMPEGSTGSARELARYIEWASRKKVRGFEARLVFRNDRFGRGGDHTPFMQAGFPAVRFTEPVEEYSRQHTENDLIQYVDFSYMANATRINLAALLHLADAGTPPRNVRIDRAQGEDTRLTWTPGAPGEHVVFWRATTSPVWQGSMVVKTGNEATLKGIHKDDHEFAVGALNGVPVPAR